MATQAEPLQLKPKQKGTKHKDLEDEVEVPKERVDTGNRRRGRRAKK
jgi:hypothetical protein